MKEKKRKVGTPKLPKGEVRHVMGKTEIVDLQDAIGKGDVARVKTLMTSNPELHRAPIGYGRSGPLTCVAEGHSRAAFSLAKWMLENGSDVHQGGDAPLMRAALSGKRVRMMELLVSHGANINAEWNGEYPIVFAACESVDPVALKWLLDHGANPNCDRPGRAHRGTALDYVIGSYVRSPELSACIGLLIDAGGQTKYDAPIVLELLRGRLDRVGEYLIADPPLVTARFANLDFGTTGGRMLTLKRTTLLHVAAEYGNLEAIELLLSRGADVNARATVDAVGVGGQTPLFHAVTQMNDGGLAAAQLLIERGADLSIRAKVPGHYERPDEVLECTPLGYALKFKDVPGRGDKASTVSLLRSRQAPPS